MEVRAIGASHSAVDSEIEEMIWLHSARHRVSVESMTWQDHGWRARWNRADAAEGGGGHSRQAILQIKLAHLVIASAAEEQARFAREVVAPGQTSANSFYPISGKGQSRAVAQAASCPRLAVDL